MTARIIHGHGKTITIILPCISVASALCPVDPFQWMKPWWNQGMWMNSGWPMTSSSNFQPVEKIALPRTFGNSSMYCNGLLPIAGSRACLGRTVSWLSVLSSFLFLLLLLSLFPLLVVVVAVGVWLQQLLCMWSCDCGSDFDWAPVGDIGSPKDGACKMR